MTAALIAVACVAAYAGINYLAWYSTIASVQRMSPSEARPWNWRALVGPFAYYPWLNRRERQL